MKILAIDTCTEVASVTLFSSEVKITRVLTDIPKSSGHILKLCDKVFKEVREDLKNIDLISYTNASAAEVAVTVPRDKSVPPVLVPDVESFADPSTALNVTEERSPSTTPSSTIEELEPELLGEK